MVFLLSLETLNIIGKNKLTISKSYSNNKLTKNAPNVDIQLNKILK